MSDRSPRGKAHRFLLPRAETVRAFHYARNCARRRRRLCHFFAHYVDRADSALLLCDWPRVEGGEIARAMARGIRAGRGDRSRSLSMRHAHMENGGFARAMARGIRAGRGNRSRTLSMRHAHMENGGFARAMARAIRAGQGERLSGLSI